MVSKGHIKLPKKVLIAGQWWKITTDNTYSGGKFWSGKCLLEIGTKNPQNIFPIFLHEAVEAILSRRDCRYEQYGGMDGNENFLFNFNHKEFIQVINDIALALNDTIMRSPTRKHKATKRSKK